jgi:hypothetical protein
MDRSVLRLPDPVPVAPHGERRCSVRQKLHTPVYVSFNGPQSGMVVDLSELLDLHENGFAVQTAIPMGLQGNERLEVNHAVTLCLELPETKKYLHGSGQVMWTDNTGRAGIRFSFLPEGSRQILKEWLFANLLVASTNHAARSQQVAHHQKQESPRHELPARESPAQELPVQDLTAADKTPALAPILIPASNSKGTAAALPDRADLLPSLDDVRRKVREIEARPIGARGLGGSSDIDSILQFLTSCALSLTGAQGAALALRTGGRMLCRARAGDPAPPVGSEVDVRAGLSGECVRNGLLVTCEDPETDFRVDPKICRMLGIGSFVAAPIFTDSLVVGLLEIFSPTPRRFTKIHGTILQRLAELVPKIEENEIAAKTVESKIIQPIETEQKKTSLTNAELNTIEQEIELPKIEQQQIEQQTIEPSGRHPNPPELNLLAAPVRQLGETQPEPSAKVPKTDLINNVGGEPVGPQGIEPAFLAAGSGRAEAVPFHKTIYEAGPGAECETPDVQGSDDVRSHATARRPYFVQVTLLLLVLGTVAMVLGYLLAPTIQKRWMGPPQSALNSSQSSQQASSKSALASSSLSLQNASDRRGHTLSPEDLRKLGEQGDAESQYQLGILYHDGGSVPKDDAQAVQWFQRAAEQGYVRAQSTLGAYYWAGRGVPQDFIKAYFWSQLALAQGDENSKSRLEGLSAQMTQSQVANARQLAEAWLHSHTQATKPNPASK